MTPVNYDSHKMTRFATESDVRNAMPGAYAIVDAEDSGTAFQRLWVKFPDGEVAGLALEPAPTHIPGVWAWNGDADKPTVTREIHFRGRWHGKITGGRLKSIAEKPAEAVASASHPLPLPPPPATKPKRKTTRRRAS